MNVLDLFSGIGGFSLGLERAGMRTVAFCEIDPYCRRVLAKHWPNVPIYDDVRTLTADALRRDGIAVDVICGGFPCQDISFAGKRAGLEGARSGLWGEYRRLIGELRPRFVIVENVPGLLSLGMGTVLGDLASLGYDATWDCIPASAVGAPHRRDRVWIVAHARSEQHKSRGPAFGRETAAQLHAPDAAAMHRPSVKRRKSNRDHARLDDVADANELARHEGRTRHTAKGTRGRNADRGRERAKVRNADLQSLEVGQGIASDHGAERPPAVGADWWLVEPDVGRVADGVPARVDRLRSLGNAVVPQIPEIIGRAIMEAA